jgi:hypothetical protein
MTAKDGEQVPMCHECSRCSYQNQALDQPLGSVLHLGSNRVASATEELVDQHTPSQEDTSAAVSPRVSDLHGFVERNESRFLGVPVK